MIRLLLDAETATNVRFGLSPTMETVRLVRVIARHPSPENAPEPWIRSGAERLSYLDVGELIDAVAGDRAYPSFLSPAPDPSGNDDMLEWQLSQVGETSPEQVERELDASFSDRKTPESGHLASAARARDLLRDQLARTFYEVVSPMWRRVEAVLRTDLAVRSQRSSENGLAVVVNSLHPRFRLDQGAIEYSTSWEIELPIHPGLVLVPSVFGRDPAVDESPGGAMQVIYPARGSALLYEPDDGRDDSSLGDVLGATRVAILVAAAEPVTTTDLAARLDMSPGAVSAHLTALTAVDWLTRRRVGRRVFYQLSALGRMILNQRGDATHRIGA